MSGTSTVNFPALPGGSTTQLQYNNAGAFGGVSGWTTNGSTTLVGGASTTLSVGAGTAITSSGPGGALTSAAYTAIGTSGATIPLLSTSNVWTTTNEFQGNLRVDGQLLFSTGSILARQTNTLTWLQNSAGTAITSLQSSKLGVTKTGNYTVVALDNDIWFDNIGAAGEVDFTLPTAVRDLEVGFIVKAAQTVKIIAGASTTIAIATSVSAAAGNITANAAYSAVRLRAISTTEWVAVSSTGSWTVT